MGPNLLNFCKLLGYEFENKSLFKQALTHCSAGPINYERLEFLGDAVLNMVIAQALFDQFPLETEGQLSRMRAHLVRREMLCQLANELKLSQHLILGLGEHKSGGHRRASILSDALEAIFGAIFLESGFEMTKQVILKLYHAQLDNPMLSLCLKDAKTLLQETLQQLKLPLPTYYLSKVIGKENEAVFHINCQLPTIGLETKGVGDTRKKAEQQAAERMLIQLKG